MPTVGLVSLGCAKNTVDSEVLLGLLKEAHYNITDKVEEAEIVIVNTCAFIKEAVQESIDVILEIAQLKNKGFCRYLIVAGCLSQRYRKELLEEIPEIDALLGTGDLLSINKICLKLLQNNYKSSPYVIISSHPRFIYDQHHPRYRDNYIHIAYIKIAEGCNNKCSYCIIPQLRGSYRSRPINSIVKEAQKLIHSGVKEINLIAQDTISYGKDLGMKQGLVNLLIYLAEIKGDFWIRILYTHPAHISDELLTLISQRKKICNYLDIPLQHINDDILTWMRRRINKKQIISLIKKIRTYIPTIALRTTMMVGFPGETDEHFEELMDFIKEARFDHMGIFKYSEEEGTNIIRKKVDFITQEVKEDRYQRAMELQSEISEKKKLAFVGKTQSVLIERYSEEGDWLFEGRSYASAPEVDGIIYINDKEGDIKFGNFYDVKITKGYIYDVMGVRA